MFTTTSMDFVELDMRKMKFERRYKIFFETQEIKDLYHELQEHRCTLCKGKTNIFTSFNQLRAHVRKEHNRSYCDICVRHLKVNNVYLIQEVVYKLRYPAYPNVQYDGIVLILSQHYYALVIVYKMI